MRRPSPGLAGRLVVAIGFLALATVATVTYAVLHRVDDRGVNNAKPCASISTAPDAPPPSTRCQLETLQHAYDAQASADAATIAAKNSELAAVQADAHRTALALAAIRELLRQLKVTQGAGGQVGVVYVPTALPRPPAPTTAPVTTRPTPWPSPSRPVPKPTPVPTPAPPSTSPTCGLLDRVLGRC